MELTEKFWKYASTTNRIDNIENIFIDWAGKEKISIDEFNTAYAEVNNQVNEYFNKKGAFSIEQNGQILKFDTMEEYNAFINNQSKEEPNNNIPQESDNNIPTDVPLDTMSESTDPAQQSIENEPSVGQEPDITQDDFKDESIDSMNKTSISPEPNSEINDEENSNGEKSFPLLDILGS